MPYTHCTSCGAKALVGATRCPRCETPFVSYSAQGKGVPTMNCPQCGVQRPVAIGACPNCFASPSHGAMHVSRGLLLAGLAIIVMIAIGYLASRNVPHSGTSPAAVPVAADTVAADTVPTDSVTADDTLSVSATQNARAASETHTPSVAVSPVNVPAAPATTTVPGSTQAPTPAPRPTAVVPDTGVWVPAVANTWVRMRAAPSSTSGVLRMIDSAQRVLLGPAMYGWRPVRAGADRGWVDAHFFTLVPAKRP